MQKYLQYTQQQEPTFASLYLNIKQIKNLALNLDGSLINPEQVLRPAPTEEQPLNERL